MAKLITDLANERMRILLYGKAGSYKTRTAASASLFEPTAPTLLLSIGGNPISIRDYNPRPTIVEIDALSDFNDFYEFLFGGQSSKHPLWEALSMKDPFKTLVIDGGTEVNQQVMDLVMGVKKERKIGELSPDTEISHYKKQLETLGFWGRKFFGLADKGNALPIHVVITALEREPAIDFRSEKAINAGMKGPSPDQQMYRPYFFGQAVSLMEAYAYVVGRMMSVERAVRAHIRDVAVAKGAHSVMLLTQTATYTAKDQYGRLGPYMIDPTMEKIWRALYDKPAEPEEIP